MLSRSRERTVELIRPSNQIPVGEGRVPNQAIVAPFHGSGILVGHRSVGQAPRLLNTAVITAETQCRYHGGMKLSRVLKANEGLVPYVRNMLGVLTKFTPYSLRYRLR